MNKKYRKSYCNSCKTCYNTWITEEKPKLCPKCGESFLIENLHLESFNFIPDEELTNMFIKEIEESKL